jgi:hypothetical protein
MEHRKRKIKKERSRGHERLTEPREKQPWMTPSFGNEVSTT